MQIVESDVVADLRRGVRLTFPLEPRYDTIAQKGGRVGSIRS